MFGPCIACRGLLQLSNIISHSYEFRLLSKVQGRRQEQDRGRGRESVRAAAIILQTFWAGRSEAAVI